MNLYWNIYIIIGVIFYTVLSFRVDNGKLHPLLFATLFLHFGVTVLIKLFYNVCCG